MSIYVINNSFPISHLIASSTTLTTKPISTTTTYEPTSITTTTSTTRTTTTTTTTVTTTSIQPTSNPSKKASKMIDAVVACAKSSDVAQDFFHGFVIYIIIIYMTYFKNF